MHEAGEVNILAVIWTIVVIVLASHLIWQQVKAAEYRHQEVLKLQRIAAEEVALVEQQAEEEARSAKAGRSLRHAETHHQEALRWQRLAADAVVTLADQRTEEEVCIPEATKEISVVQETGDEFGETRRLKRSPKQLRIRSTVDQEEKSLSNQALHLSPSVAAVNSVADSSSSLQQRASVQGSSRISGSQSICAVCAVPTKKHCSKCKAVKYCSQKCQIDHWHERHKHECHELQKELLSPAARSNASSSDDLASIDNSSPVRAKSGDPSLTTASLEERLTTTKTALQSSETVTQNGILISPARILFPYEQFVELFTWKKRRLAPCGLLNAGNSCFANVVLQCLTYTTPLTAYLLEGYHVKECQRNGWCFMCELQRHVSKVMESWYALSPSEIVSKVPNIGKHMGNGSQEDAHEFMRYAIDSMQSICLDKVGGEEAVDQQTQETTLIQHIFGGHLQSQIRCVQCYHESYKYENMMDIAVEIQRDDVTTLQDALAKFTSNESLDGDNKYKCDKCNAYVKAQKRLLIHKAPNVLTIALKRFQSGNFGKLNKRVTFPNVLDMTPFMSKDGDRPSSPYELYAVIVHIDTRNSSFCGHYICYIKDLHGFWYKIDDHVVTEVDLETVMEQIAYMLLYKRSVPRNVPLHTGDDAVASGSAMSNGHNMAEEQPLLASCNSADTNNFYGSNGNGVILSSKVSDILTQ